MEQRWRTCGEMNRRADSQNAAATFTKILLRVANQSVGKAKPNSDWGKRKIKKISNGSIIPTVSFDN